MNDLSLSRPKMELMTELLEAGVHYGHQTKRWHPKMRDYILEERNSIYIINLEKTVEQLAQASLFLGQVVQGGGRVLFVGTKKQAQEAVKEAAIATGQFFVNQRWLGGTLTNLITIRKSVARMQKLEALEGSAGWSRINKQEASALHRESIKLHSNLDGIAEMETLPDAIVVIDTLCEKIAISEANRLRIPIVAVVDTNSNPSCIDYPIAGNDDAIRSVRMILQMLVDAIYQASQLRGKVSGVEPDSTIAG
ncbi:30S ribosomal protein S2 [Candidatus Xiphinematobacter sp. Idaho Grape]|uniref:30S ribosomal protein S2 n=1 Tax=Candidatus Xiphinematobacter sp. Idaho Grape TaxID=1704307 RepID=UPI0007059E0E|nr:30S ribosomal protein S2 [Candidatus Xiphinematobacter sp. Idaho Grape]ALJ56508.1 30S ribosomal protein S2 [Candidatus Xiphinematobacter sp. Idaho Grape]